MFHGKPLTIRHNCPDKRLERPIRMLVVFFLHGKPPQSVITLRTNGSERAIRLFHCPIEWKTAVPDKKGDNRVDLTGDAKRRVSGGFFTTVVFFYRPLISSLFLRGGGGGGLFL